MNQRILVIDFEPRALGALKELLEGAGYQVRTAGSGQDIVAALKEWVPALVVVEPMIPGQDGFKLCQGLKRGKFGPVPVIVVASRIYRGSRFRDMAMEAGADLFLERPQNDPLLLPSIQKLLPLTGSPVPRIPTPSPLKTETPPASASQPSIPTPPPPSPAPSPAPAPTPVAAVPPSPEHRPPSPGPKPVDTPNVFSRLSDGDIEEALCRALGPPTDSEPLLSRTAPTAIKPEVPSTPPVRVFTSHSVPPPVTGPSVQALSPAITPPVPAKAASSAPQAAASSPENPADFFGSDPSLDSILDRVFPMASPVASQPVPSPTPPVETAPPTPAPAAPRPKDPGPRLTGMFSLDETFDGKPSLPTEVTEAGCNFELVTMHEESKPAPSPSLLDAVRNVEPKPDDFPDKPADEWQSSDVALGTEPEDGGPPPSGPVPEGATAGVGKPPSGEDLETALDNVFARITGTISPEALAGLTSAAASGPASTGASSSLREVPEKLRGMDAGTADLLSSLEELENSIPDGAPTSDIRGDSVWTGSTGFEATGLSRELEGSIPLQPPPAPEDERTLEEVFARLLDDDKDEPKPPARQQEPDQPQAVAVGVESVPSQETEPSSTGKKRPFWANWLGLGVIASLVVFGTLYRLLPLPSFEQTPTADTGARTPGKKPGMNQGIAAPIPPPRVVQSAKKKPKTTEKKPMTASNAALPLPDRPRPVAAAERAGATEPLAASSPESSGSFRPIPEPASGAEPEFGADEPIPASMVGPPLARSNELDTPLRLVSGNVPHAPPGTVNPSGGRVVLHVLVGPDGTVRETRIMFDPGGGIGELARKAVLNWRYSSPVRGGEPVQVWKTEVLEVTPAEQ